MKKLLVLVGFALTVGAAAAQAPLKTENIIVVTFDGFRWQEMFTGADSSILNEKKYTPSPKDIKARYWADSSTDRRKKLAPFIWSTVAKEGQIYGNRALNCPVNVANKYRFSYPGYNEIFTGFPDDSVNSNNKVYNKNVNVLEYINQQKGFQNKVAAFASWDCFPYIFNDKRSSLLVNGGLADLNVPNLNDAQKLLNKMQYLEPRYLGDTRLDFLTYYFAKEYVKQNHPRVAYIGFDETDDMAHEGKYDMYLHAVNQLDSMVSDLWRFVQADPQYKNKTTLFITCDHGRGAAANGMWRHHGANIDGADQIWFAVIGPDTPTGGEMSNQPQLYQKQFAQTFAHFLGLDFKADHPIADPLPIAAFKTK